jgi:hypothetical protein
VASRSLRRFGKRIRELAEGLEHYAASLTQEVAEHVHGALVLATPVDTGLARSNWTAAVGAPDLSPRTPRLQLDTIHEAQDAIRAAPADSEIHVANGVPYLAELNAGSSRKAPAGFVERIAAEGAAVAGQARLLRPTGRGRRLI